MSNIYVVWIYPHCFSVGADDEVVGTETALRLFLFRRRRADHRDVEPKSLTELDGYVPQSPEAHHAEPLTKFEHVVLLHRAKHGDSTT